MMKPAAAALLLVLAVQDDEIKLLPGDPTDALWPVSAQVSLPDETFISGMASRIERRWDARLARFNANPSDRSRLRAGADVARKAVRIEFKAGTPGLYKVKAGTEEQVLGEATFALGKVDALFKGSPAHAQQILKTRATILELVELLKDIASGRVTANAKVRDGYSEKVAAADAAMDKVAQQSDLTGTAAWLRHWLLHMRDVQIWNQTADNPMSKNDPQHGAGKKGFFVDPNLTIVELEKGLKETDDILDREIRLSISILLAELFGRAVEDAKRLPVARKAAAAALGLADASTSPSKDFREAIEAAKADQDPAEARDGFAKTVAGSQ